MTWFTGIFKNRKSGTVVINGEKYVGNKIQIDGGTVIVDGKVIGDKGRWCGVPIINISVDGDCEHIQTHSGDVTVGSSSGSNIITGSGDVYVGGSVYGFIKTGSGDVTTTGTVSGSVTTGSGDITMGRK